MSPFSCRILSAMLNYCPDQQDFIMWHRKLFYGRGGSDFSRTSQDAYCQLDPFAYSCTSSNPPLQETNSAFVFLIPAP